MYGENVIDGLKRLDRVEEAHRPMCDPGELQRLVDRLKSPDIHAIHFVAGGTIQTFPTDRVFPSATITLDDLRELISDVTKDQPAEGPKPEGPGPVPEGFRKWYDTRHFWGNVETIWTGAYGDLYREVMRQVSLLHMQKGPGPVPDWFAEIFKKVNRLWTQDSIESCWKGLEGDLCREAMRQEGGES